MPTHRTSSAVLLRSSVLIGTVDLTTPTAISDVFASSLPQSFSINLASGVKIYTPARRTPRRARGKHATIRDVVFEDGLFFWAFMDKPVCFPTGEPPSLPTYYAEHHLPRSRVSVHDADLSVSQYALSPG